MVCVICKKNKSMEKVKLITTHPMDKIHRNGERMCKIAIFDPRGISDGVFQICHPHADVMIRANTWKIKEVDSNRNLNGAEKAKKKSEIRFNHCGKCGDEIRDFTNIWLFTFQSENKFKFRLAYLNHAECCADFVKRFDPKIPQKGQTTLLETSK